MSSVVARKNGSVSGKVRYILLLAVASCIHCNRLETKESALAPAPSDAEAQAVLEERLNALGYLGAVEAPDAGSRGVRVHEPRKIQAGWTLLSLRHSGNARLLATDGEVVHRWHTDVRNWKLAIPHPNGDLLVLAEGQGVLRIDRDSRVLWRTKLRAHHDLVVDANKHIWTLGRQKCAVSLDGVSVEVNDNTIVELSSSGDILQEISLLDVVDRRHWEPRLRSGLSIEAGGDRDPTILGGPRDIFHANSVDVVSQAIPGICQQGALLVSIRSLNLVAIIDRASMKMVWQAPTNFVDHQHHATFLENGHLLVFDNGPAKQRSRVLEIDPVEPAIVWEYDPGNMFTKFMGAAQPLPNGNVLITVSHQAELREVTREGEIVWQYAIPDRSSKDPKKFRTVYRATRIPADFFDDDAAAGWARP